MRRARAKVRRLALSNDFRWFVTLTLDPQKVDRYDPAAVVRKLNQWCSNQVKRKGLCYILVPERHKDGALHFHGFFNDALEAVDSGHKSKDGRPHIQPTRLDLGLHSGYGNLRGVCRGCGLCLQVHRQARGQARRAVVLLRR